MVQKPHYKTDKLATKKIQKHMVKNLKLKNNGIKHARMYILKYTKLPGVLLELVLTNSKEQTIKEQQTLETKLQSPQMELQHFKIYD